MSNKIITVSHFEKNRIAHFFLKEGDNRLTAVYNGVSEHFKPVKDKADILNKLTNITDTKIVLHRNQANYQ